MHSFIRGCAFSFLQCPPVAAGRECSGPTTRSCFDIGAGTAIRARSDCQSFASTDPLSPTPFAPILGYRPYVVAEGSGGCTTASRSMYRTHACTAEMTSITTFKGLVKIGHNN